MSIEKDAALDLPLSDSEAGQIAGGTKSKKSTRAASPAAKTRPAQYLIISGSSTPPVPGFDPATAPASDNEDCGETSL